ncbi:hypothetical protein Z051_19505 [Rhodococcus rhodochrous KG-21]|uniref:Uncharacterized protein n=1 Tax=Rhodococcus rhodochrous KG-21 TaxID=1441923 RepID=A0A0M8PDW3_RHORH|nr:hypothetical protein Z051_19505 [Rhodococcus rhodochrous KG-21]
MRELTWIRNVLAGLVVSFPIGILLVLVTFGARGAAAGGRGLYGAIDRHTLDVERVVVPLLQLHRPSDGEALDDGSFRMPGLAYWAAQNGPMTAFECPAQ